MPSKLMIKSFLILVLSSASLFPQGTGSSVSNDSLTVKDETKAAVVQNDEFHPFTEFVSIIPNAILQLPPNMVQLVKQDISLTNIWNLTSITVSTFSLMSFDQQAFDGTSRYYSQHGGVKNFEDVAINFGDGKYQLAAAGVFATYGAVFSDRRSLKTGSDLVEALVATGLVIQLLKRVFGRESPAVATEMHGEWTPWPGLKTYQQNQPKYYSYPSGHIATTFTAIAVFANNYPEQKWIMPVGLLVGGVVGVGLVAKGMHWYSDLPLGAAIGNSIGNIVSRRGEVSKAEKQTSHLSISPAFLGQTTGLSVSYSF